MLLTITTTHRPATDLGHLLHKHPDRVEKHMGSRAIAVVCRDEAVGADRFGVEGTGAVYTRTGRAFFDDPETTEAVLARIRAAVDRAGLWETLDTGWLVLDCELLPWSAKAGELISRQYAAVGAGAQAGLEAAVATLESAAGRGLELDGLLDRQRRRAEHAPATPTPAARTRPRRGGRR